MLSILKLVTTLIIASIIAFVIYKYNTFRFFETHDYDSSLSQFITLKGADEYVISVLTTKEEFHRESEELFLSKISVGRAIADVLLVASFKYYVKLGELKYAIENDTLVFTVPQLYLSKPVAYDTATEKRSCNSSPLINCQPTLNNLLLEITGKLEEKGNLAMTNMYEKSAKTLADNFDSFVKQNNKEVFYKNIAVIFANEPSQSRRMFNYNKSYCGDKPCSLELPVGNGRLLTIQ